MTPAEPHVTAPIAAEPETLGGRYRLLLIALTLGVAATVLFRSAADRSHAPASVAGSVWPAARNISPDRIPVFSSSWITPVGHTPSAHSCSVCVLPDGDLLAIWFGGSREGAADVALFTARLAVGSETWTVPVRVVDRESAQQELGRAIRKIGNAVVFPDGKGGVWMIYVTVTVGGWSGSALNFKTSRDDGRTWGPSQRLMLNPFFNLSSLVRNQPMLAADGRIGLPIYHEMARTFPQLLWLTPGPAGSLASYGVRSLPGAQHLIQPVLVPLDNGRVFMALRDHGVAGKMHSAFSEDRGWTWSPAVPGELPNPDAAVGAIRVRDGRFLLVYNDSARGRENLRLAVSSDAGRTWRAGPVIENEANQEFSYPALVEDDRGRIHLAYTWKRQRIKHVEFNLAWLDGQLGAGSPTTP